jgi:hypothetical protein
MRPTIYQLGWISRIWREQLGHYQSMVGRPAHRPIPPFRRGQRRRMQHELPRPRVVSGLALQPAHVATVPELCLCVAAKDVVVGDARPPLGQLLLAGLLAHSRREH